jgi:hypothetical protein
MALSDTVKTAVDAAFAAADDAVQDITYHRHQANADYDTTNGTVIENATDVPMECIFSGYSAHETRNQAVHVTDVKGLIPGKYFDDFEPDIGNDTLTDASSKKFDIINAKPDPLGATYVLQLRRIA